MFLRSESLTSPLPDPPREPSPLADPKSSHPSSLSHQWNRPPLPFSVWKTNCDSYAIAACRKDSWSNRGSIFLILTGFVKGVPRPQRGEIPAHCSIVHRNKSSVEWKVHSSPQSPSKWLLLLRSFRHQQRIPSSFFHQLIHRHLNQNNRKNLCPQRIPFISQLKVGDKCETKTPQTRSRTLCFRICAFQKQVLVSLGHQPGGRLGNLYLLWGDERKHSFFPLVAIAGPDWPTMLFTYVGFILLTCFDCFIIKWV